MVRPVLDKGYVRLTRIMAEIQEDGSLKAVTDNAVADDARVSFHKRAAAFTDEENAKLVGYLGREEHTSPFRGCIIQFEVKAPMFVRNQWYKYVIGSDHEGLPYRDPFFQWNEVSRRYVTREPEFYIPSEWRSAPKTRKQGSGEPVDVQTSVDTSYFLEEQVKDSLNAYNAVLEAGICAEQARLFLAGYAIYTSWRWTASLQAVCHFLAQRLADDAQMEIQQYAQAIHGIVRTLFPRAVAALINEPSSK